MELDASMNYMIVYLYTYIRIYVHACVYMCACACVHSSPEISGTQVWPMVPMEPPRARWLTAIPTFQNREDAGPQTGLTFKGQGGTLP